MIDSAQAVQHFAGFADEPSAGLSSTLDLLDRGEASERLGSEAALLGNSLSMRELNAKVLRVAPTNSSVLLIGENGTGKEFIARAIHDLSLRANEPFVVVDCAALAPERVAAELFGESAPGGNGSGAVHHEGHSTFRDGQIVRAGAGTLVLVEITRLPLDVQWRLLEALESGHLRTSVATSGGVSRSDVRCRVLATTSADAQQAVEDGHLRADLLYRLAEFPILVPALRQRDTDPELLAQAFLNALNVQEGAMKRFSADSLTRLRQYSWPGNVWELRNVVHRAFVLADEELDLRTVAGKPLLPSVNGDALVVRVPVGTNLAEAERWMIIATLKKCGGNKTRAAALLGVSLKTLYNRLNTYRAQGQDLGDIDGELTEVAV